MNEIVKILMERDNMSEEGARALVEQAHDDMMVRLGAGEMPYDICSEWFGLEPDYIDYLI